MIDLGLAVVLPLHCHLGFGAIVTDYLPKRKFPRVYPISKGLLIAGTGTAIYGLWSFNTKDVGICEAVSTLWNSNQDLVDNE